jgi:pimeloyl-ACP methyl ester carboxylesterase
MTQPPTAHTFGRGTVSLHAWEWPGDPPPTLLLHGIGNYARYWDFFADAVAGRLRLIATDARGHGESGRPAGDYAPQEFVADAVAVLDALAIDRAFAVGHSMGGTHAIRLAAAHPDTNRLRWLFREEAGGLAWRSSHHALTSIMTGARRGDLWDALRAIRCPVLLVRGTRSNVLSAGVAQRMVKTLADARLIELDAGHNVALDRPTELANAVVGFALG